VLEQYCLIPLFQSQLSPLFEVLTRGSFSSFSSSRDANFLSVSFRHFFFAESPHVLPTMPSSPSLEFYWQGIFPGTSFLYAHLFLAVYLLFSCPNEEMPNRRFPLAPDHCPSLLKICFSCHGHPSPSSPSPRLKVPKWAYYAWRTIFPLVICNPVRRVSIPWFSVVRASTRDTASYSGLLGRNDPLPPWIVVE